jgi:hypothetical protein
MSEQQPEDDQSSEQSDQSEESDQPQQDLDSGEPGDVGDDQLPEDLQPTEDNPLARHPGQTGQEDDEIGADREDDPDTAPLTPEESDYGSGESSDSSGDDAGAS